ncbi:hypothetical protein [uncultured Mediterranean phage uvMED]|nr:hypothetical protein [uncultured Mediterranean phage uvMED]
MEKYAPIIERAIKDQMKSDKLYVTGDTSNSVSADVYSQANSIAIGIDKSFIFDVLQFGRKAGKTQPPYEAIASWMKRKGVKDFAGKSTNQTAYTIAKSIGEKGTIKRFGYQGRNISQLAVLKIMKGLLADSSEAYIKDVEQHLKNSTSKNVN